MRAAKAELKHSLHRWGELLFSLKLPFDRGTTNFSGVVAQAKEAGVEHVVFMGIPKDAALVMREANNLGWKPQFSGHNALEVAALASNVYIGSATNYQGNPPGEDFIGAGQREIKNALSLDGVSIVNNLITTTPDHPSADHPSGFGTITGIRQVPGTFSGARILELSGKVLF